jgi:hypothetical protein
VHSETEFDGMVSQRKDPISSIPAKSNRSTTPQAEKALQPKLELAAGAGARLRELGELLGQLPFANNSGKAERMILAHLSAEDHAFDKNFIARLVQEILEARMEMENGGERAQAAGTR